MKQKILTVETECLCCYAEGNDFKVGELGDHAASWHIPMFVYSISCEILAYPEDFYEICDEVAHKQSNSY